MGRKVVQPIPAISADLNLAHNSHTEMLMRKAALSDPHICYLLAQVIVFQLALQARFAVPKPGFQLRWLSDPDLPKRNLCPSRRDIREVFF